MRSLTLSIKGLRACDTTFSIEILIAKIYCTKQQV